MSPGRPSEILCDSHVDSETPKARRLRASSSLIGVEGGLSEDEAFSLLNSAAREGDEVAVDLIGCRQDWRNQIILSEDPAVLCESPHIAFWPRFLSRFECAYAMATARSVLRQSVVINSVTGKQSESAVRVSETAWLQPDQLDPVQQVIFDKIVMAFGGISDLAEPISIVRYKPGGVFLAHLDAYKNHETGQLDESARATTSIIYLNEGYEGGGTAFIEPKLKITGQTGDMLHFRNLTPSGEVDLTSVHAGMPVMSGEKWILVLWLRHGC